jgi:RHS repeat-associated protein
MGLINAGDGSVAARYEYGPFGELLRATGPMAKANPFRFSTKYQDDETDLVYYGVRYLKTTTGGWLSRDPIGERGGINLYGYVGNDLINRIDPLGLAWYDYIPGIGPGIAQARGEAAIQAQLARYGCGSMQEFQLDHPGYGGTMTSGNLSAVQGAANIASGAADLYVTAATSVTPTATGAKCLSILAKNGTKITGFTGHGIERAIGDAAKRAGVKPQAILDALHNPTTITSGVDQLGRPFQIFTGENARVVVNPQTGQVVSVNPLSGAGAH